MKKSKLIGKIFGIALVFVLIGTMLGGSTNIVNATSEKTTIYVTDPSPWFTKGSYSGHPEYWWSHTYNGNNYISTYVGGMSWLGGSASEPDAWAQFTPYLAQSAEYDVYAYFYACADTSTKVPFTIYHAAGSTKVIVNQYSGSPAWKEQYLGRWDFAAGSGACVMVTDATGEPYDGVKGLTIGTIRFVKVNQSPTCSIIANPRSGLAPLTVTFSMSANDLDGWISAWALDPGDGSPLYSGPGYPPTTLSHTYTTQSPPSGYSVALMVSDNDGDNGFATETVAVGPNIPPTCSLSAHPSSGTAPLTITFTMAASDSDGWITTWLLNPGDGNPSYSGNGEPPSTQNHVYTSAGTYTAVLAVSDNKDATFLAGTTVSVNPPVTSLTFTELSPETITRNESNWVQTYSAVGTNLYNVNQIGVSWSGPDSGSETWDKGDSNWNAAVTVNSDTSMTLLIKVLDNESGTQSKTWTWTVILKDNTGATASRQVTVNYNPLQANEVGRVVLTEPLEITPSGPYSVGNTLTATFTVENQGDAAITLDKLLLGGRYNYGELPGGGYPDFTYETVTLQPGESHPYQGTFFIPQLGEYGFFIAYYIENPTEAERQFLDENNWNTCIELGEGLTDADRTRQITVTEWTFAIITDLHIGRGYENYNGESYYLTDRLNKIVDDIRAMPQKPKFVAVLGDISNKADMYEFEKAQQILNRLNDDFRDDQGNVIRSGIPYLPLIGNHDAGWRSMFGYYFWWGPSATRNLDLLKGDGFGTLNFGPFVDGDHNSDLFNFAFTCNGTMFIGLDNCGEGSLGDWHDGRTKDFLRQYVQVAKGSNMSVVILSHIPVIDPVKLDAAIKPVIYAAFGIVSGSRIESTLSLNAREITGILDGAKAQVWYAGHNHGYDGWPGDLHVGNLNTDGVLSFHDGNYEWPSLGNCRMSGVEAIMKGCNAPDLSGGGVIRVVRMDSGGVSSEESAGNDATINPRFLWSPERVSLSWWPEAEFDAYMFSYWETTSYQYRWIVRNSTGAVVADSGILTSRHWVWENIPYSATYSVTLEISLLGGLTESIEQAIEVSSDYFGSYTIYNTAADWGAWLGNAGDWVVDSGGNVLDHAQNDVEDVIITVKRIFSPEAYYPVVMMTVHFEQATADIDLSGLTCDTDIRTHKSFFHMETWPAEIETSKILFIPSSGSGAVYIGRNETSLDEVSYSDPNKVIIHVGETIDGMTVTTAWIDGRAYYVVSGVTETGGGEVPIPNQPTNVLPADEATGITPTPTLSSSDFSHPDTAATHAASQWQITTTSGDYSSPVFDSSTDSGNLTSITISSGTLSCDTTYYWHVKYQDSYSNWSDWSAETSFSTLAEGTSTIGFSDDFSTDSGMWEYLGFAWPDWWGEGAQYTAYRDVAQEYVVLTPNDYHLAGAIWCEPAFTPPFTVNFRYFAGGGSGANGLVLMFCHEKPPYLLSGGCLSFIGSGYGIEFDEYWENGPTPAPHIAIIQDDPSNHLAYVADSRVGDNAWHNVSVVVDSSSITVYIDSDEVLHWEGSLNTTYGGLGFAAFTGGYTNWHLIDDFSIKVGPPLKITSCDASGNEKNQFGPGESVYVKGTGLEGNTTYKIWIQPEPVVEGQTLSTTADPSEVQELVTTSFDGSIEPVLIWEIPSNFAVVYGQWDIVFDKQDDGENTEECNFTSDGIDSTASAGFAVAAGAIFVPDDYPTIQAAVDAASPGDTIVVRDGTYAENVHIDKGLTLRSENGPQSTIIEFGTTYDYILEINASYVTVAGFQIKAVAPYPPFDTAAIRIVGANHCVVSGNELISWSNCWHGIAIQDSDSNTIVGNKISGYYDNLGLTNSHYNTIEGNSIIGSAYHGVVLSGSNHNTVVDNTFTNDGLFVADSYNNTVQENTVNGKPLVYLEGVSDFTVPDAGQVILVNCNNITVDSLELSNTSVGVELWNTNNSRITNNTIGYGHVSGIYLGNSNGNTISANVVGGYFAIQLASSDFNVVTRNEATGCYGIYTGAAGNLVYLNNFDGYYGDLVSGSNTFHSPTTITYSYCGTTCTSFLGNYWGKYSGSDSNVDGLGDTPYLIEAAVVGGSEYDYYPLMSGFEDYFLLNWGPMALDDAYKTYEGTVLDVPSPGVLDNDTDVDSESLTAVLINGPSYGSLTFNADGSFSYTPNAGWYGSDSFTYKANDGALGSDIAAVTITVAKIVTFPDPNLEAAIREAIGKHIGDIYSSDLVQLTILNAIYRGITNLSGMEYCTNLIELYLGNNQISDLTPLQNLTNLIHLSLEGNQITNLTPIQNLINLTHLSLEYNQISNLTPLSNLSRLIFLGLHHDQVSDLNPLSSLTSLVELYLGNNQISNLTPLQNLTNLTHLSLEGNQITNLTPLQNLINLTHLSLEYNQISNLTPLSNLGSLVFLVLHHNQISDLTPLSNLSSLLILSLDNNQISDVTPLQNLTNLTYLSLPYNQISDISALTGLTQLLMLNLQGNQVDDISALSGCGALEELYLANNNITGISPLSGLLNLRMLSLDNNHINNLTPLQNLTNLTYLSLPYNRISDVSALAGLTQLLMLNLQGNQVDDISALSGCSALEQLYLAYNNITTIPPLFDLLSLRILGLDNNQISDISGLAGLTQLQVLNLQGNQVSDISDLSGMATLQELYMAYNNITSISPLSGLLNLRMLSLDNNQISDVTPLQNLTNLTYLSLPYNQISDISSLARLTQLQMLNLQGNQVSDISALSGMVALQELCMAYNNITTIPMLSDLTSLRVLGLDNNQISEISGLAGLTQLQVLNLQGNQVSDISALSGMVALQKLYMAYNNITTIPMLSDLTSLRVLGLDNNQISEISGLAGLTQLQVLNLQGNQVSDISTLSGMATLQELYMSYNNITSISPLSGLLNLRMLSLDNNQISDVTPLQNLTNLTYLSLPYNQISNVSALVGLTQLLMLNLQVNQVDDVSALSGMVALHELYLAYNNITDTSPLSGLASLHILGLDNNQITNIESLVSNTGLSEGDLVNLMNNPLDADSVTMYIPELKTRGVIVWFNSVPVAMDDIYSVDENAVLIVPAPGVLSNDTNLDGDTLAAGIVTWPVYGNLILNGDGSFSYTPWGVDYNGTDTFTYATYDGTAWSNIATVTITVNPVNDAPLAVDDACTTIEGITLYVAAPGVLNNDTDVDSASLTAVLMNGPSYGTLTLNADGAFTYTPNTDWYGTDSFTYKANDGALYSNIATVTIMVNPVPPTITDVSPNRGTQSKTLSVTITGTYLTGAASVGFGSGITVNSFAVDSSTQITANMTISGSATTGVRDVSVTTPGGMATKTGGFTVNPAPPTITTVSPNSGVQGQSLSVTITGTYFTGATLVSFGPEITVNNFMVDNSTQITADISISGFATAAVRDVTITTAGGTDTLTNGFTVVKATTSVSRVNPTQGTQGQSLKVTIYGANFTGATAVNFGAGITVNSFTVKNAAQITSTISISGAAVPGSRNVSVSTPGGTGTLINGFTVLQVQAPPTVTSVTPNQGSRGQSLKVTITGTSFTGATAVSFGTGIAVIGFMVDSSTQVSANITIAAHAKSGLRNVSVTTSVGKGTLTKGFVVMK